MEMRLQKNVNAFNNDSSKYKESFAENFREFKKPLFAEVTFSSSSY